MSFIIYFAMFIGIAYSVPNGTNYVAAPARVIRDALELTTTTIPVEEDLGPLGEVQLDVDEEDLKVRVRRGYGGGGGATQRGVSKYGGGQRQPQAKYNRGNSGGSKYGNHNQNQGYGQKQQQEQYGGGDAKQGGYY